MQQSHFTRFSVVPVTSRGLPNCAAQDGPRFEKAHRYLARLCQSDCLPITALPAGTRGRTARRIEPAAVDITQRVSCILTPASWNVIEQSDDRGDGSTRRIVDGATPT